MSDRPIIVPPGEGARVGNVEFLARTADTPRFTLGIIEFAPGRELEQHVHDDEDDSFYILEGELTFLFGDETQDGRAGDVRARAARGPARLPQRRRRRRCGCSTSTRPPASTGGSGSRTELGLGRGRRAACGARAPFAARLGAGLPLLAASSFACARRRASSFSSSSDSSSWSSIVQMSGTISRHGEQAEVELAVVAHDRHVQADAVGDRRQRVVAEHQRAGRVERELRPGDVRDHRR